MDGQRNEESKPPRAAADRSEVEAPPLVGKWLLERVVDRVANTTFKPVRYGGLTFSTRGVSWSDGCNTTAGSYLAEGYELRITRGGSSLRGCNFELEDVHYDRVTHFRVDADTLTLETPRQTYELKRFPYSRLSQHSWSLYEIVDLSTGEHHNVDRFRLEYRHLLISFEDDARFHFTDLNHDEFTGVLTIRGSSIEGMHYDASSLTRVQARPVTLARLKDSYRDYTETAERYPTTLAQLIDWPNVTSFRLVDGAVEQVGTSEHLELLSNAHIYVFTPR